MNFEYSIPVEELDKIIEKMNMGIEPFISDMVRKDVELRRKELMAEILDEDIDEVDMEEYNKHKQKIKAHQEAQKRKATRSENKKNSYITLTREKYAKLYDDIATSYVEYNPECPYHLSDNDLNSDAEYVVLKQKMAKLRHCYYNQKDWVNAVNVIIQMAKYECSHDYSWLGYVGTRGIEAFNNGNIKINKGVLPKLFIDFSKELTDPSILASIMKGDTTIVVDNNENNRAVTNKHKSGKPISVPYTVMNGNDYDMFTDMKNNGVNTPIDPMVNYSNGIFNRANLLRTSPIFSMLNNNNKSNNNESRLYDFMNDNSGITKYNNDHNIKSSTVDIIKEFNKDNNNNKFNRGVVDGVQEIMSSLKNETKTNKPYKSVIDNDITSSSNEDVIRVEQGILNAIRNMNPNINK